MAFLKASCSFLTTSGGVSRGAAMPKGEFCTMSRPSSFSVGASGNFSSRFSPQVFSTRILPACTSGAKPVESDIAMMWPPLMAVARSALPLYGMWFSWMPSFCAISSVVRCGLVSVPVEP
jgi:hypothetical protein